MVEGVWCVVVPVGCVVALTYDAEVVEALVKEADVELAFVVGNVVAVPVAVVVVVKSGFKQQSPFGVCEQEEYCVGDCAGPQQSPPSQSQPQILLTLLHFPFPLVAMFPQGAAHDESSVAVVGLSSVVVRCLCVVISRVVRPIVVAVDRTRVVLVSTCVALVG